MALRERMWLTALLVNLVLCCAGAVILLPWRQQRLVFSRSRHELNLALRNNEELYRSILHASIDGFWLGDMQGRLLEVNETYCRMSGYPLKNGGVLLLLEMMNTKQLA